MKLLFICTSLYGGGAEKIVSLLTQQIRGEIVIAVFNKKEKQLPYGGHLFDLGFKPAKNPIMKIWNFFIRLIKIYILKKRLKADVVISFMQPPNMLNLLTKDKSRTIISVRNYDQRKYSESKNLFLKLEHNLLRFFIGRADSIVTVSEELTNFVRQQYDLEKGRLVTIHNGCDIDQIRNQAHGPIPKEIEKIFQFPTLINSGKLESQKGQKALIKIFSALKKEVDNLKLVILGEGSLKLNLLEFSKELGLTAYMHDTNSAHDLVAFDIYFFGHQKNPYPYLKKSTIFVLSSLYEGFPNVVIEAMACGLPIVSANCKTGPKEILIDQADSKKKYGILLPELVDSQGNPQLKAEKIWIKEISDLLRNEAKLLKFKKLSDERVQDFSLDHLVQKWNQVIQ